MSVKRGQAYNEERYQQIKDFSGVRYGNITPTDVDGLIDFGNKTFVLIEIKCAGQEMPEGQRLALTRVVDNLEKAGKNAVLLFATHKTKPDEVIDCANTKIIKRYRGKKWTDPPVEGFNLKEQIDSFLNFLKKDD